MTLSPELKVPHTRVTPSADATLLERAGQFWGPRLEILCGRSGERSLFSRLTAYNRFERAWYSAKHLCGVTDPETLSNFERFLDHFQHLQATTLKVGPIIAKRVKENFSREVAVSDYHLEKLDPPEGGGPDGYPKRWNWRTLISAAEIESSECEPFRYSVFMDAPAGFLLLHQGVPCAFTCFYPAAPGMLMINSIQGVRGEKYMDRSEIVTADVPGCRPIRWREALVEIVKSYAEIEGCRALGIQGGRNNRWLREHYKHGLRKGKPHMELWQAKRSYDRTARCLGFSPMSDGNWYMAL